MANIPLWTTFHSKRLKRPDDTNCRDHGGVQRSRRDVPNHPQGQNNALAG